MNLALIGNALFWQAEKEARRLRRVQANRESARQTIRRKQVLCEELARKAGELHSEKQNLAQVGHIMKIKLSLSWIEIN